MRWRLLSLSLGLGLNLLCAGTAGARELIACGHPDYPPVSWAQGEELTGLAPAVARQLFTELGYTLRLDLLGNWKRCLQEVQAGNADIVVAAYRISRRERYLAFSKQHIIADPLVLFVHRSQGPRFQSLDDLKGKTVGLLLGDSFGEQFDRFVQQHNRIEYVSQGRQNFAKLALQRIDFMPLGRLSGSLQSRKLGYHDQITPTAWEIDTEFYYLAVGQHSGLSRHLPLINQRLSQMHRDGTIKRLRRQYSERYLQGAQQEASDAHP